MDITPSPEFCAAARIVLGGDTPNIVIPALRTKLGAKIEQIHSEILEGKRVISFPPVPPAGALEPLPHMLQPSRKRRATSTAKTGHPTTTVTKLRSARPQKAL
jgi:hypothetical protein